jgi:mono/diheme cytochrome c family protein
MEPNREVYMRSGWLVLGLSAFPGLGLAQEQRSAQATKAEYEGWRQYMVHCARCHGDDAVAGVMAPDLRKSIKRGAAGGSTFDEVVTNGRPGKGMPPFGKVLKPDQIAGIRAYVTARAKGKLPAGRPGT